MVANNFEKAAVPAEIKSCRRHVGVKATGNRYYKRATNKAARRAKKTALRNGDYTYRQTPGGYIS
jgi:hypothetical protein